MRAHPLPEARAYADLMLSELRKVIPSFLKRVDLDDRGVAWSTYLASTRESVDELAADLFPDGTPAPDEPSLQPTDWDPDGEVKLVAPILYSANPVTQAVPDPQVSSMPAVERMADASP